MRGSRLKKNEVLVTGKYKFEAVVAVQQDNNPRYADLKGQSSVLPAPVRPYDINTAPNMTYNLISHWTSLTISLMAVLGIGL